MQFGADTNKVIFAQALSGADQDDSFSPHGGGRKKDWRIFTTKEQLLPRQVEYSVFSRLFVYWHTLAYSMYMLCVSVLCLDELYTVPKASGASVAVHMSVCLYFKCGGGLRGLTRFPRLDPQLAFSNALC